MNACPSPSLRADPVPPRHQAFVVAIDGPRVNVEPVQATPNAPLPARFCGLSLERCDCLEMSQAWFLHEYTTLCRERNRGEWAKHDLAGGYSMLDHQRKKAARGVMAVVAAVFTSADKTAEQLRGFARRFLLLTARKARTDSGLRAYDWRGVEAGRSVYRVIKLKGAAR
jgi:hypothetical protein